MRPRKSTIISAILVALVVASTIPHTGRGVIAIYPYVEVGACRFLEYRYNDNLQLLAETPGSRTYYVASDNLLASQVLASGFCRGGTILYGSKIQNAIYNNPCCNHGFDGMHDLLLGRPIPLPIHDKNLYNVTRQWYDPLGNYTVFYEDHNATGILSDTQYGDIAAYTAMELEQVNTTRAMQEITLLRSMYDGTGIHDFPFTNGQQGEKGVYQTFKLALYIIALRQAAQPVSSDLESRLLAMQSQIDGGFYTGYNNTGAHFGQENAETTSIATMALRAIPGTHLTIVDYTLNLTGSQFRQATIRYSSEENWTRDFEGSAFWDTTQIGDNKTDPGVLPGQLEVMNWTQNITFNTLTCHTVTITVGGTTTDIEAYCPSWLKYWYLFLIPVAAAPILSYVLYRRMRRRQI